MNIELQEAAPEAEEMTFAEAIEADGKEAKPVKADVLEAEETEEVEAEAEADETEAAEGDEDGEESEGEQPDAPKLVEWIDDNGKAWQVPEDLTPALFKNKDYTSKTQQLAEARREFEEARAAFEADTKRTKEDLALDAELARLEAISSQYDRLNWDELAANDLYDAQQKQFQRSLVKEEMQKLSSKREARRQERLQEAQSSLTKRVEDADAYARANIPGWDQGKDREFIAFAKEVGYDDETLRANISAPFVKMLHLAWLGKQGTQTAKKAAQPVKQAIQPNGKVSGKSGKVPTNPKRLADAGFDEYHAAIKRGADPRLSDL